MKARRLFAVLAAAGAALLPAAALAQDAAAPDGGNTAWILTSTALVLFMTMPGLALFYGGLVRSGNVLSVLMHCFAICCLSSILWIAGAYSLAFTDGGGLDGLVGGLSRALLDGVGRDAMSGDIPETVFFMFQMTFAIITPALIVGAYVERIRFSAVLLFSGAWLVLVYAPVCHWVWGGGWLGDMGVRDFAGGLVVHLTCGASALVLAALLGARTGFPNEVRPPHSPGMVMTGAAMLWVGWFGFNGGSALAADGAAGMAVAVTHISAAAGAFTWMLIEWARFRKPTLVGIATGAIAGLATITPASGYVGPAGGLAIGARRRRGVLLRRRLRQEGHRGRRFARRAGGARRRRRDGSRAHRGVRRGGVRRRGPVRNDHGPPARSPARRNRRGAGVVRRSHLPQSPRRSTRRWGSASRRRPKWRAST